MEFRIELGYLLVGVLEHFSIARRAGSDEKRSFSLIGVRMVRLPLFLSLGLLLATSCLAQQTPVVSAGSVPVFAIDLDKLQWSKNPNTGPLEFATIVGDRG